MRKYSVWYQDFDGQEFLFMSDVPGYDTADRIGKALIDNDMADKYRVEEE